jgi:dihydroorotate dehydrogenase electron transfer subunit
MNSMIQQECQVQSCREVAAQTYLLRFASAEIASLARPGQFVNVLTAAKGEGPLLRRPMSISRVVSESVEILFHVVGSGTHLLSQLKPGDSLNVLGPLGQPFRSDAEYDTAVLVAGGIGIAPFPFLTEEILKRGKRIESFVGYRNRSLIFTEGLHHVRIATDDGSDGFHGTVIQLLEASSVQEFGKVKIFACGPTIMLRALTAYAKRMNFCCELSLEGEMACGIGICQGCAVERTDGNPPYALVCKDGPSFLSTDVQV